jgi:hypothetical protein
MEIKITGDGKYIKTTNNDLKSVNECMILLNPDFVKRIEMLEKECDRLQNHIESLDNEMRGYDP